jgi:hypothetical protein
LLLLLIGATVTLGQLTLEGIDLASQVTALLLLMVQLLLKLLQLLEGGF